MSARRSVIRRIARALLPIALVVVVALILVGHSVASGAHAQAVRLQAQGTAEGTR